MKITITPTDKNEPMQRLAEIGLNAKKFSPGTWVLIEPVKGTQVQVMEYETVDSLTITLLQVKQNIAHIKSLKKKS